MATTQNTWPDYVTWESQYGGQRQQDHLRYDEMLQARTMGIASIGSHRYKAASAAISANLNRHFPEDEPNLTDYTHAIESTVGPIIEVGGPTEDFSPLPRVETIASLLDRKSYVANIDKVGGVALQADGASLPFARESLGIVMASCLPHDVRPQLFTEAQRVLEDDGIFMYKNCSDLDVVHALTVGFTMLAYRRTMNTLLNAENTIEIYDRTWSFIAQK